MDGKYKFEVIIGTYEQFLVGYKLCEENGERTFVQSFANHSHQASVKSLTTSGKWLASSGNDETIHIYDMVARKQCGSIMEHNGTVTCVAFTPNTSHLVSASEDGTIALFRTGSWQMEKVFKDAHKGLGVTCVAVHPTGKMAMSLGKDLTLRTWNLVKGRSAFTTNLSRTGCKILDTIVWSPGGDLYAVVMDTKLELFSVTTAGVCHVYHFSKRITAVLFVTDVVICVGEDDGSVSAHSTSTGLEFWRIVGKKRVRGLASHKKYLVVASSSGNIAAYKMKQPAETPRLVAEIDAGCRVTCLAVCGNKIGKIKEEKPEDDEAVETSKLNGQTSRKRKNSWTAETGECKPKKQKGVKCIPKSQKWAVIKATV